MGVAGIRSGRLKAGWLGSEVMLWGGWWAGHKQLLASAGGEAGRRKQGGWPLALRRARHSAANSLAASSIMP